MTLEEQVASLNREEVIALLVAEREQRALESRSLEEKVSELSRQLDWWRQQYFGSKSEKRHAPEDGRQLSFGELIPKEDMPELGETVKAYQRRHSKKRIEDQVEEEGLRFDSSVPVEIIPVENPDLQGLEPGKDYEIIGEKVTHRIAQRSAYVVLRYVRQVVKLKGAEKPTCLPAPASVLERSYADVSFLAWLLIDKFMYHLPLYRQHQRLTAAGITLSRQTLTNLVERAIALLEPVYYAQLSSILLSEVLLMDETYVKAGQAAKGKLNQAYFWPVYGDKDEVAFAFAQSRKHEEVGKILGSYAKTLVTDGYEAYARFAEKTSGLVHALCWSHTRRQFLKAETATPELVKEALRRIGKLYDYEERMRKKKIRGPDKLAFRAEYSRPVVADFFSWLTEAMRRECLEPSNLFCKAASYALERRTGLEVFLSDPEVPIDTNELERIIRPIPMGRRNWLFCWTELGAEYVGKIQSLLQTCRLQGIDPYTWLVDVLQRVDTHPAFDVHLLTPRLWKQHFAAVPLRSAIDH